MTARQPLSLDQYRTALTIDRQQALELLHQRAETRKLEAALQAERQRMLLTELAELRKPSSEKRSDALRAARKQAMNLLPLLDEARRIEQQWRLERDYPHVWTPKAQVA
jgi:hypothetical protein